MSKTLLGSHQDLVDLAAQVTEEGLVIGEPILVDQKRICDFADATGDHQWIHVDFERARTGPFGQTIAHGYLTLSLTPGLLFALFDLKEGAVVLNYGLNKVRFPSPVPSGSNVTARVMKLDLKEIEGGTEAIFTVMLFVEGISKPCCVMEAVYRFGWAA